MVESTPDGKNCTGAPRSGSRSTRSARKHSSGRKGVFSIIGFGARNPPVEGAAAAPRGLLLLLLNRYSMANTTDDEGGEGDGDAAYTAGSRSAPGETPSTGITPASSGGAGNEASDSTLVEIPALQLKIWCSSATPSSS